MAPLLKASLNSQENLKRINPRSSLAMKGPTHDDLVLPCHRFSQDAASDRLGFARGGAGAACRNKISESSGVFWYSNYSDRRWWWRQSSSLACGSTWTKKLAATIR